MEILVVGYGVIGTIYGYIFKKANHNVEHLIRNESIEKTPKSITISILDGRTKKKEKNITDKYDIDIWTNKRKYDFIFISVSSGKLEGVINSLINNEIEGTILLFSGTWDGKQEIEKKLQGMPYVLGYPVAGGNKNKTGIDGAVFPNIVIENENKSKINNYSDLRELLKSANIVLESPYNMLEWIWLHMGINAAVISTAAQFGDFNEPSKAANEFMKSRKGLSLAIKSIRETLKIIESRNVNLKNYKNEIAAYKIPRFIASMVMKNMFAANELTRKIMELHNNKDDLIFVCRSVYDEGKNKGIAAPLFYRNFEKMEGN